MVSYSGGPESRVNGSGPGESWEDEVGARMRDFCDHGLPGDFARLAALAGDASFRELEALGHRAGGDFRPDELLMRLEFLPYIEDAEFAALGLDEEEIAATREFAFEWAEEIKLRRAEDGDLTPHDDDFDIPDPDI
ncbi:hypothetical protein D5H75_12705 [Bailinhaonella thermotolerans]|uniref:Uncharacterized protein n=2 Tax=Bailinhaonella thermotolerans TaxID=1070861 RepID=A0A3A4AUL9_9ACTN|nr:hypothetical protein D5H75_12705 [Bailinhaonella thermotolerans]